MKLCFVVNQLYKQGGVEKTLHSRLQELSKYYEVYLITLENGNKPFYFGELTDVVHIDLNLNFDRKPNTAFKLNTLNVSKSLYAYIKLQRALFKIKPSFTVNVMGAHSFYFLPHMQFTGNTVLEHHSSFHESPPSNFKKDMINKFNYHIFLTEEECEIASFIDNKKIVIPNPIQNNNIKNTPYSLKKNRIIAAGRIVEIKGFDRLIKAWNIIHKEFPDWVIEIYGEPDSKVLDNLKAYIKDNALENSIDIRPSTSYILDIINDSKIYAMTSHFECFPMVILEAISLGALVIAFDCPTGPRNIIDNNMGYLVENDNIESFAMTLKQAITNEENSKILAAHGMRKSREFSMPKVVDRWKQFFADSI